MNFLEYVEGCWIIFICDCLDDIIFLKTMNNCFAASVGYLKFGFNREEGGVVYREWAPAAQ